MKETAKRAAIATLVVIAIVVAALALWKLKLVIALLFLAFIIAAAMCPGIDALRRRGVPRSIGLLIHYLGLFAVVGLFLWAVVPRAIDRSPCGRGDQKSVRGTARNLLHPRGCGVLDLRARPCSRLRGFALTQAKTQADA